MTLNEFHANHIQPGCDPAVFDILCDHRQAHERGNPLNRAHNGKIGFIAIDVADKTAVSLDEIQRDVFQSSGFIFLESCMKPFSEACGQNKQPILEVLRQWFVRPANVLEIGSGTGQHAAWFGRHLPHLDWQTSDLEPHHAGIRQWLGEAGLANVRAPLVLDVSNPPRLTGNYGYVFSANTLHIMDWPAVEGFFRLVGRVLEEGGLLAVYGPFNYQGRYSSDSNARFDQWLRQRDPRSGIRDVDDLGKLADENGLCLAADIEMPVNNRILVWRKTANV